MTREDAKAIDRLGRTIWNLGIIAMTAYQSMDSSGRLFIQVAVKGAHVKDEVDYEYDLEV